MNGQCCRVYCIITSSFSCLILLIANQATKLINYFQASQLLAFIEDMSEILSNLLVKSASKSEAASILAQSLLHDLVFTGESKKSCLHKKPEVDPQLDLDGVERQVVC